MLSWICVSTVKLVNSKHCFIHMWKSMHSQCTVKADSPRSPRRGPQRGLRRCSWTWVDDNFYVTHTRADPCRHAAAKSMNWPLGFNNQTLLYICHLTVSALTPTIYLWFYLPLLLLSYQPSFHSCPITFTCVSKQPLLSPAFQQEKYRNDLTEVVTLSADNAVTL